MPLPDLTKLTIDLSPTWAGYLRDWDRSLRSGNFPETTRYNYLLAAAQLGRYLTEYSPDPDADEAAADPAAVTRYVVLRSGHSGPRYQGRGPHECRSCAPTARVAILNPSDN
jgi:hypothetical protein